MTNKGALLACLIILVTGMLIQPPSETLAQESSGEGKTILLRPFIKLGRGVLNLGSGWLEFPLQIYRTGTRDGWVAGTLLGPINGFGMFIVRTVGGAYEILTFPLPLPPGYQPMFQPEFLWSPDLHPHDQEFKGLVPQGAG